MFQICLLNNTRVCVALETGRKRGMNNERKEKGSGRNKEGKKKKVHRFGCWLDVMKGDGRKGKAAREG